MGNNRFFQADPSYAVKLLAEVVRDGRADYCPPVLVSYYWLALFLIESSETRIIVSVETRIVHADPVKSVSQLEDVESLSLNIILQPIFYKFWPSLIAFFWRSCAKFDILGCSKKTLVIRLVSASTMLHGWGISSAIDLRVQGRNTRRLKAYCFGFSFVCKV